MGVYGDTWFLNPEEAITAPAFHDDTVVVLLRRVEPRGSGFTKSTHVH